MIVMRGEARALLVVAVMGAIAAQAAPTPHPDFTGVFVLDMEASGSLDALLEAMGRSWVERKAASKVTVTHTVKQEGDAITIQIDSAFRSQTETVKLDGTPTTSHGLDGREITVHSRWSDDGQSVISEADLAGPDSKAKKLVVVRSIEDGGKTMRQRIEVTLPDDRVLPVDRVFRRK